MRQKHHIHIYLWYFEPRIPAIKNTDQYNKFLQGFFFLAPTTEVLTTFLQSLSLTETKSKYSFRC